MGKRGCARDGSKMSMVCSFERVFLRFSFAFSFGACLRKAWALLGILRSLEIAQSQAQQNTYRGCQISGLLEVGLTLYQYKLFYNSC
jgi:hypothetical protein